MILKRHYSNSKVLSLEEIKKRIESKESLLKSIRPNVSNRGEISNEKASIYKDSYRNEAVAENGEQILGAQ